MNYLQLCIPFKMWLGTTFLQSICRDRTLCIPFKMWLGTTGLPQVFENQRKRYLLFQPITKIVRSRLGLLQVSAHTAVLLFFSSSPFINLSESHFIVILLYEIKGCVYLSNLSESHSELFPTNSLTRCVYLSNLSESHFQA